MLGLPGQRLRRRILPPARNSGEAVESCRAGALILELKQQLSEQRRRDAASFTCLFSNT